MSSWSIWASSRPAPATGSSPKSRCGRSAGSADVLEAMDPDDAADLLGTMTPADAEQFLRRMDPEDSEDVRRLLSHSPDTAGGLMTSEPVVLAPDTTVAEALARVRDPDLTP